MSTADRIFAKYRLPISRILGVLMLAFVLVAAPPRFRASWIEGFGEVAGLVLLALAALGRIWCAVYINGRKDKELQTSGPYSITRNPLYVFSFAGAVGFGLAVENPWLSIGLALWFVVYYSLTVSQEEHVLASLFGDDYARYCAVTPRWIPNFRLYREPPTLEVFPGRIAHAILDAMWFVWAFALWEVLEELRRMGIVHTWL